MKLVLDSSNRALHVAAIDWSAAGEIYAFTDDSNSIQLLDANVRISKQVGARTHELPMLPHRLHRYWQFHRPSSTCTRCHTLPSAGAETRQSLW